MIYVNARFVTQPLTGVQRYAFEICMQLKNRDAKIVFLCPPKIVQQQWATLIGVKVIGKNSGHLWEQFDLPRFLRTQPRAVLFSPCNTGPLFFKNQMFTLHDLSFKWYPQFNTKIFSMGYTFLIGRLCRKVKHIFTVSETVKKEISEAYHIPAEKISVTFNGISKSFKTILPHKKEKIILTVGSLSQRKNLNLLIRAFKHSALHAGYKLIIVGKPGNIYPYTKPAADSNIVWVEDATDEELRLYYSKAEIACFMSLYEGFGIPVLEALQYHCKVICSDIPVFRELYKGAVYFCDPQSELMLSQLLDQMSGAKILQEDQLQDLNSKYDYELSATLIYQKLLSL